MPRGNLLATNMFLGHMICTTATHNRLCETTSPVELKEKIASNYYGVNRTENCAFFICEETRKAW